MLKFVLIIYKSFTYVENFKFFSYCLDVYGLLRCFCQKGNSKFGIVLDQPARPAGQEDVIALTAPKMDTVRVGFIGLGMRGPGAVKRFTYLEGVKIVALCDIHPERVEAAQQILKKAGLPEAVGYSGTEEAWKQLCDREDIDLVYICTDWKRHTPMAVYAMEHGKHVACEVPIAMTVAECWELVNTSEKTRKHCMMLENCCYDFFEMATLNMAQKGVLGEIVHAGLHPRFAFSEFYGSERRGI